jgi:hypothetical protein
VPVLPVVGASCWHTCFGFLCGTFRGTCAFDKYV